MSTIKPALFLLFFALIFSNIQGQISTYRLHGKIRDSLSKEPLPFAIINIVPKTKSLKKTIICDILGIFDTNIPIGSASISVNILGYKKKDITIVNNAREAISINLYLVPDTVKLDSFIAYSPMRLKNDTLEYDARAFEVKENALLERLLKKLPGLYVDYLGNIKYMGKDIDQMLLDGRPFFDGKIQTIIKNLPAEMVSKIQIYNQKDQQSALTGFDNGGGQSKMINIVTKRSKRNGFFGKIATSFGTPKLYSIASDYNSFNDSSKISIYGKAQNIDPDFGATGTMRTNTITLGSSFDIQKVKMPLHGSYELNRAKSINKINTETNYYLPDGNIQSNKEQKFDSLYSLDNTGNVSFQKQLDSATSFNINGNITIGNSNDRNITKTQVNNKSIATMTSTRNVNNNEKRAININALLMKRLKREGSNLSLNINFSSSNNNNAFNNVSNTFEKSNTSSNEIDSLKQQGNEHSVFSNINSNFLYAFPINIDHAIELGFNTSYSYNKLNKNVFLFDNSINTYSLYDSSTSSYFSNNFFASNEAIRYKFSTRHLSSIFGFEIQQTVMRNNNYFADSTSRQTYQTLLVNNNTQYNFHNSFIQLVYNGQTFNPSSEQLNPVINNSNPLNITIGNPNLKPEIQQSFRITYNKINPNNFSNLNTSLNFQVSQNKITTKSMFSDSGKIISMPININGNFNIGINSFYSFRIQDRINIDIGLGLSLAKTRGFVNNNTAEKINITENSSIGARTSFFKELNIDLRFNPNITSSRFSDGTNGQFSYIHNLLLNIEWIRESGYSLSTIFSNSFNGKMLNQNSTSVTIWNMTIGKDIFKNTCNITLSAIDLLNRGSGLSRSTTSNFYRETQTNNLGRYFLFSFIFRPKHFN